MLARDTHDRTPPAAGVDSVLDPTGGIPVARQIPHDLVPRQTRRPARLDDVEQEVARTADLVLKLTALADRYDGASDSARRVRVLRETADRGRRALVQLAAHEAPHSLRS